MSQIQTRITLYLIENISDLCTGLPFEVKSQLNINSANDASFDISIR